MVTFYVKNTGSTQSSIFCSINYTGVGRFVVKVPNSKINVKEWKDGWIKTGRGKQDNLQKPIKLTTSSRSKLTTYIAGEDFQFSYVSG